MAYVIKSHPRHIEVSRTPSVEFTEWAYEGANPSEGDDAVWFTAETSGGFGLYALGRISSSAESAGKNNKGNDLVKFKAEFYQFEPQHPLGKSDFSNMERIGYGNSLQVLNKCLYINSHVKVAEIDEEIFQLLVDRF